MHTILKSLPLLVNDDSIPLVHTHSSHFYRSGWNAPSEIKTMECFELDKTITSFAKMYTKCEVSVIADPYIKQSIFFK